MMWDGTGNCFEEWRDTGVMESDWVCNGAVEQGTENKRYCFASRNRQSGGSNSMPIDFS